MIVLRNYPKLLMIESAAPNAAAVVPLSARSVGSRTPNLNIGIRQARMTHGPNTQIYDTVRSSQQFDGKEQE